MAQPTFHFEEFELNVDSCELRRSGLPVKVERIPMELLILLLENPGKLVRREAINERLWGDGVFIEAEHGINTAMNKLRATLRDDSRDPRFIRTVVGRGYRFIAEVNVTHSGNGVPGGEDLGAVITEPALSAVTISPPRNGYLSVTPVGEAPSATPPPFEPSRIAPRTLLPEPPISGSPSPEPLEAKESANGAWPVGRLIIALLLLVAVVGIAFLLLKRHRPVPQMQVADSSHSVAVLPFRNLGRESDQEYVVDGMTDQLITDLGKNPSLRVISRGSVMQYKAVQSPAREIARQLGVDMIVEGSYLRAGEMVRITAQLMDARNDRRVWSQTYEESDADLLAIEDQVTNDIAQQVAFALGVNFAAVSGKAVNARARDAYLRGRYLWNERTVHGLTESIRYYNEALRADPDYAEAYAALAESYVLLSIYDGVHPSGSLLKAQSAAERALQLNSRLGQAHTALAAVKADGDRDWSGAEREYRLALQLNPGDPTAHHWYALHLSRLGRWQEAETEIQRALALDPLSLIINTDAAEMAYWSRKPELAMSRVDAVLILNPGFAQAHLIKGKVLEQLHRYREAEAEFQEAGSLFARPANLLPLRAHAMALAGDTDASLKIARELEASSTQRYVSGVDIGQVYCALHRTDDAMRWLGRANQAHDTGIDMLKVEPLFDGCRADSRFQGLVSELHLGD